MANISLSVNDLEQALTDLQDAAESLSKTVTTMKSAGKESLDLPGTHYTKKVVPQIVGWAAALEATVRVKLRNFKPEQPKSETGNQDVSPRKGPKK